MNYSELRAAALKYWTDEGGWMPTAQVYDAAFADQDKVRFQLVCSSLVLEGNHALVRRKNPDGHGLELKVRTKDDPPYVEPVKKPRKKVVELPAIVSSAKPVYVRPGTVAQTPPEIRRHEPNTMPVAHHKIVPPPKHTPMAAALANFNRKDLTIEVPPTVAVQQVPFGASGTTGRSKGDVVLPQPKVNATAVQEVLAAHVDTKRQNVAMLSIVKELGQVAVKTDDVERRVPEEPTAQTLGGLLDAFLSMARPMVKSLIREAVTEAILSPDFIEAFHAKAQEKYAVNPVVESNADQGSAPAPIAQKSVENIRHKPVMPGDLEAERIRLPKVAVIGLTKAHQETEVKEAFAKKFDIITIQSSVNSRIIRKYCESADKIIVLTDHIPHQIQQSLNAYNFQYEKMAGGVAKLKQALQALTI